MKLKKDKLFLFLIIFWAFLIGLGNPFFDFPLAYSIPDEFESQRLALTILNTKSLLHDSYYPPLWAWIQIPFIVLAILLLKIFSVCPTFSAIKQAAVFFPGIFLPIARILSSAFSALSAFWVYKIGKLLYSKKLGLIACLLFALSFMRVNLAHFGRVTSIFLFCSLGFLYFCLKLCHRLSKKNWYLALIFLSLAILSYQVGLSLVPFLGLSLIFTKQWKRFIFRPKVIALSLVIIAVCFAFLFLDPKFLQTNFAFVNISSPKLSLFQKIFFHIKIIVFYELPYLLFALFGSIRLFKLRKRSAFLILVFGILPFFIYFSTDFNSPRYIVLLLPFLTLTSGFWFLKNFKKKLLFLFLACLFSLVLTLHFNFLMFKKGSYTEAKEWVEKNIPKDSAILASDDKLGIIPKSSSLEPVILYSPHYHQKQAAIFENKELNLKNIKNIRFFKHMKAVVPESALQKHLKESQYDYLIVIYYNQEEKRKFLENFSESQFQLVKSFYPTLVSQNLNSLVNINNPFKELFAINQFGPFIEIYSL